MCLTFNHGVKPMYFDTSNELILAPHLTGMRLQAPIDENDCQFNVKNVLAFPCNTYFLTPASVITNANDICVEVCGFDSLKGMYGTTANELFNTETAIQTIAHDLKVVQNKKTVVCNESSKIEEEIINFLTIKSPLFDAHDNIVGIFGCSIQLNHQPLAESLALIQKIGLMNNNATLHSSNFSYSDNKNIFSSTQHQIIHHTTKGRTASEIAIILNLSRRTIENNLVIIKEHYGVRTKSQLIEKILF
jgi:DNA-binding CsgD family transcriptional regulator